jgi:hypothetical protein
MTCVVLCISGMSGAVYIKGVAVTKYKRWGMVWKYIVLNFSDNIVI